MSMNLTIAIAQINSTVGGLNENTRKICSFIVTAKRRGADIVVFPELAITGYHPKDLLTKPGFIKKNICCLEEIRKVSEGICVITGFVDAVASGDRSFKDVKLYNAAAIIYNGEIIETCHKTHLPNYDIFDEKRYFTRATKPCVFRFRGVTIGVNICEDVWFEDVCMFQRSKGAEVIVNLSASPFNVGKMKQRVNVLSQRAIENSVYLVYVNLVGGQDDLVFDGGSSVINTKGEVEFEAPCFVEKLFLHTLGSKQPLLQSLSKVEEIYYALLLALKDYVVKNGFMKVILGLSGGIDSALTAVLCVDALGRENVIGVSMPSHITSKESKEDAYVLAQNLGIVYKEIPIERIFKSCLQTLETEFAGTVENVAEENLQARIRGNLLMALSNKFGYLVVTTGNKSELAVGYATLYGDMAGGLALISDVPKTWVYRLAEYINQTAGCTRIPSRIISKEPSAELREGQKDTDSLPPYPVLDLILKSYIEENKSVKEIIAKGYDQKIVQEIIWRVDHNEYKRKQSPPGIKVTTKAFGTGRRMPITNRYSDF
ncbi:MAG: NH(3)-dependent NAD(+) synthetase [Candidatus Argoarchaeum ethanivorans]|uniref:Glutamine-dependent NAD(+) synthetase n=1 Tax=Candidatus Argoarchaeum ethanivorans TaxID=2608793 RepID=A0A811TFC0_9EURY|nr:MAG: NH(3)-dependent NAD(+) synthetase [Candidatus Argoarchaeum ethanivorans]